MSNNYERERNKNAKKEAKVKKGTIFFTVFSVMILFTTTVFAQPQRGRMIERGFTHHSPERILSVLRANQEELKITEEQLEKIKNIVFSFEEEMIKMRSEGDTLRLELKKIMQDKKNRDYEKIRSSLSRASNIRQDMFIKRLKIRDEIQNVLTSEQQNALKEMKKGVRSQHLTLK